MFPFHNGVHFIILIILPFSVPFPLCQIDSALTSVARLTVVMIRVRIPSCSPVGGMGTRLPEEGVLLFLILPPFFSIPFLSFFFSFSFLLLEQAVRHEQEKGASPSPRRTPPWPTPQPSLAPSSTVKDTS